MLNNRDTNKLCSEFSFLSIDEYFDARFKMEKGYRCRTGNFCFWHYLGHLTFKNHFEIRHFY